MADKQLTAKVRLNTTQAEKSIENLVKKINKIDNTINKVGNNNRVEQKLNKSQSKIQNIIGKVNSWAKAHNSVENGAKRVNSQYKKSGSLIGMLGGKLKNLADTYLGVMGMKAIIGTSDMITSAENKLNYVSAQQLGSKGTNADDGSYSTATLNATQDAMDKMYASSQKVRMGYTDMMSNVSKSMALAGDAFNNNTDMAIRFQEIMAEAYAVGGASAQEMSSSMYQLIQALGSGTLAGDELRSVREGAPLAYKEIEKFAQKTLNSKDSLKDLASQGLITADMVTKAVMQSGEAMDKAFAQTEQTFGQTWEQIKNAAIYAFKPISEMLRETLNNLIDSGFIQKVETVFSYIAKGIMIVIQVLKNAVDWIADNWYWLQYVVGTALIVICALLIKTAAIAIWSATVTAVKWLWANKILILIAITIMLLWYVWQQFTSGFISACDAIIYALIIVGTAIALIGLITDNVTLFIIGLVLLVVALIISAFEEICYGAGWLAGWIVNILSFIWNIIIYVIQAIVSAVFWLVTMIINLISLLINLIVTGIYLLLTFIWNVLALIANSVMACGQSIVAISHNVVAAVINVAVGLWNSISAIAQNIGIAFQNAWTWAKNTFWEFIADVLRGVSKLEPVINGIAKLIGKGGVDFGGMISAAEGKKSSYKSFVSVGSAWSSGMDSVAYKDVSDAWSKGWNTVDRAKYSDAISAGMDTTGYLNSNSIAGSVWDIIGNAHTGYVNPSDWGKTAGDWGAGVKDWINTKLSKFQNTGDDKSKKKSSWMDEIGKKLGLDFGDLTGGFPSATDPKNDLSKLDDIADKLGGGSGDGSGGNGGKLGKIGDDVSKIADSVDLTEEDLDHLRKIAEMEWKKEYTTASITVDMSNYNTINGESDLDGIVTKLADKLYEEMNIVANGVYA